eukprot:scaffold2708_cov257-Pinguiococcus_pyrenoidosus.AAC.2
MSGRRGRCVSAIRCANRCKVAQAPASGTVLEDAGLYLLCEQFKRSSRQSAPTLLFILELLLHSDTDFCSGERL